MFPWFYLEISCTCTHALHIEVSMTMTFLLTFKVKVYLKKMKIHSLSAHPLAEWKSGRALYSTKHFWSFAAKQNCSILLSNWGRLGLVLKTTKNVGVIRVSRRILALKRVQITSSPLVSCNGAILMFRRRRKGGHAFKTSPHLLQFFKRYTAKPSCCETSPDFPPARGWVDNDYHLGVLIL